MNRLWAIPFALGYLQKNYRWTTRVTSPTNEAFLSNGPMAYTAWSASRLQRAQDRSECLSRDGGDFGLLKSSLFPLIQFRPMSWEKMETSTTFRAFRDHDEARELHGGGLSDLMILGCNYQNEYCRCEIWGPMARSVQRMGVCAYGPTDREPLPYKGQRYQSYSVP